MTRSGRMPSAAPATIAKGHTLCTLPDVRSCGKMRVSDGLHTTRLGARMSVGNDVHTNALVLDAHTDTLQRPVMDGVGPQRPLDGRPPRGAGRPSPLRRGRGSTRRSLRYGWTPSTCLTTRRDVRCSRSTPFTTCWRRIPSGSGSPAPAGTSEIWRRPAALPCSSPSRAATPFRTTSASSVRITGWEPAP